MTRTVAVTGATGFIGRHLVDALTAEGWRVRALTRRPGDAKLPDGVDGLEGSLEDEAAIARLAAGAEALVHCAGLIKAAGPGDFARVNVAGTERLARAAEAAGVRRLVLLSSLAAREPALSPYAASKRDSERALAAAARRLDWVILRPPAVYGPGDRETLALFRLMRRGFLPIPRLPEARVSVVHVGDLCHAIATLLQSSAGSGATYEIRDAAAAGHAWRDLAAAAEQHLGRRVRCLPLPRALLATAAGLNEAMARLTGGAPTLSAGKVREFFHPDWVCRDNPLTGVTAWQPRIDLRQGFAQTLSWYREAGWL